MNLFDFSPAYEHVPPVTREEWRGWSGEPPQEGPGAPEGLSDDVDAVLNAY